MDVIATESVMTTATQLAGIAPGIGYFFALLPDETTRLELSLITQRLRRAHRLEGMLSAPGDMHLELCPIGRLENPYQPMEPTLLAAGAAVRAHAFALTLDSVMRLSPADGRYPYVLAANDASAAAMLGLRLAIARAQVDAGLVLGGVTSFLPHIPLLRGPLADAAEGPIGGVTWQVREFALIRRFFGQLRHEVAATWPLEPAPAVIPLTLEEELASLPDFPMPDEDEEF
jgi:2'-5' RNA ligase